VGYFVPMGVAAAGGRYVPGEAGSVGRGGEFVSKQIPAAQLEQAVRENLEMVFNEDSAALKSFVPKK
jgi:hypothetical protein